MVVSSKDQRNVCVASKVGQTDRSRGLHSDLERQTKSVSKGFKVRGRFCDD